MEFFSVINGRKSSSLRSISLDLSLRCSLLGFDLNRIWSDPSTWAHPEIFGIKTHIMKLNEDPVRYENQPRESSRSFPLFVSGL